jgi:hypothetical protein
MTIQDELLALRSPLTGRYAPAGIVHWASQHPDSKLYAALDWNGSHESRERHIELLWIHFGLPRPLPGWEHESLRDLVTSYVAAKRLAAKTDKPANRSRLKTPKSRTPAKKSTFSPASTQSVWDPSAPQPSPALTLARCQRANFTSLTSITGISRMLSEP